MSPAASSSSVRNCRSVAAMAASAMLLTNPMCRTVPRRVSGAPGCTRGQSRPDRRSGPGYFGFNKTGMGELLGARRGGRRSRLRCRVQGLIEVGQDVVDVFGPDAQADHL